MRVMAMQSLEALREEAREKLKSDLRAETALGMTVIESLRLQLGICEGFPPSHLWPVLYFFGVLAMRELRRPWRHAYL
jgi:hypothetical protein